MNRQKIVWTVDFCSQDPDFWSKKNDSFQEALIFLSKTFDVYIVALHINSNKDKVMQGINYHFCKNIDEMVQKVKIIDPDIINLWGFERPINLKINQLFPGKPKTVYIVGQNTEKNKDMPYVSRVFVSTSQQRNILCKNTLYPRHQIIAVPWTATNIYNFKDYAKPDRYDVIFVSDWKAMKRQHLLLEAIKLKSFTFDRICFLGDIRDQKYYEKHRSKIRENPYGCIERIDRVPGFAVPQFYHESKIAVQLSSSEGGSRVVTEVLSSGVPLIVCSDCESNCNQIKDGENGYIVQPDPQKIGEKIAELLADKNLRERIAKNALREMEEIKETSAMRIIFKKEFERILAGLR